MTGDFSIIFFHHRDLTATVRLSASRERLSASRDYSTRHT
jgi:hypothetical protein